MNPSGKDAHRDRAFNLLCKLLGQLEKSHPVIISSRGELNQWWKEHKIYQHHGPESYQSSIERILREADEHQYEMLKLKLGK